MYQQKHYGAGQGPASGPAKGAAMVIAAVTTIFAGPMIWELIEHDAMTLLLRHYSYSSAFWLHKLLCVATYAGIYWCVQWSIITAVSSALLVGLTRFA